MFILVHRIAPGTPARSLHWARAGHDPQRSVHTVRNRGERARHYTPVRNAPPIDKTTRTVMNITTKGMCVSPYK